jgi:dihydrolipoamide dehydrogenase
MRAVTACAAAALTLSSANAFVQPLHVGQHAAVRAPAAAAVSSSFTASSRALLPRRRVLCSLRMAGDSFDYDVIIVGCGVGGHGAALHARACGKVLLECLDPMHTNLADCTSKCTSKCA